MLYREIETGKIYTEDELYKKFSEYQSTVSFDEMQYMNFADMIACETEMGGSLEPLFIEDEHTPGVLLAARDNKLYDYIANNYWDMSNDSLKEVLLMAIATIIESNYSDELSQVLLDNLLERLV